jgi:hypothetical protein
MVMLNADAVRMRIVDVHFEGRSRSSLLEVATT